MKNKCLVFKKANDNNKKNRVRRVNSSKILVFSLMGVFMAFSLLYLFQVTDQTVNGFIQEDLKSELKELERVNESLNIQAMQLSEINRVDMNSMGMVKVAQVEYLKVGDPSVAMAR